MKLTVEDLVQAIQSARSLERLQSELRDAMIEQLMQQSSPLPANTQISGAPHPVE